MTSKALSSSKPPKARIIGAIAFTLFTLWVLIQDPVDSPEKALVVYCAHDARFSQSVLDQFSLETGIPILVRFDTEATKSLGLIERIKSETGSVSADVFWNNEFLGMLELAEQGLLQPYRGEGWARIPESFRDPEGLWTGFGARMRVWVTHTNTLEASSQAIHKTLASEDLSRVGLAKPLYGTTLTHYAALWQALGPERLKALHAERLEKGIRILNGNATSCNLTADGVLDLGFTDTDDAFVSLDATKPIGVVPVELASGHTLVIPNTVGILKRSRHPEKARQLVDFLLSAENELRLARSQARQIPLGPVDPAELPEEVRALQDAAAKGLPLHDLLPARQACLLWLKTIYP